MSERTLQRRLYDECETAEWDPDKQNSFAEEIAHLHEEVSEAFREWRLHKDFKIRREANGKPTGIPVELADVLIGMFYNAELHGFDLLEAVELKHAYNLTRNYAAEGRRLHEPAEARATLETGKAGVSDAETLAAEPGQSVVEPADRVRHPGTHAPEQAAVLERAASLLAELYEPAGVLVFWSSRITYLDGKRPCDLWRDRDMGALTTLCDRLDAFADGVFA